MKRSAIIPAAFVLFAFTGCSTIRQYHLAPEDEPTPTTVYVIDIGTALAPEASSQPTPTTNPPQCGPGCAPTTASDYECGPECATWPTTIPLVVSYPCGAERADGVCSTEGMTP